MKNLDIGLSIMLVFEVFLAMLWVDGYGIAGTIYQVYLWGFSGLYLTSIVFFLGYILFYDNSVIKSIETPPLKYWQLVWSLCVQSVRIWFLMYMGLTWLPVVLAVSMFSQIFLGTIIRQSAINSKGTP